MIFTIMPLVEVARKPRQIVLVSAHILGLVLGATIVFVGSLDAGRALGPVTSTLAGPVVVALIGLSFAGRMPQSRWQVPPRWLARYQATGSLAYGFVLGLGLVTKAPYVAFLGSLILVAALGTLPVAILAAWLYAAGRAVPLLVLGLLHPTTDYRQHAMALLRSTNLVRFVDRLLAIAVTVVFVVAR